MLHNNRRWSVAPVDSAEELAHKLTQHTWCGCNGFEHADLLYLNDSTSADGVQEYGVVRRETGEQIESITFSWCSEEGALEIIRDLQRGAGVEPFASVAPQQIESYREHQRCNLCA